MKQQDFDTRPLAEGLRELAGQAADAPGLFDAVAAGAQAMRFRPWLSRRPNARKNEPGPDHRV